MPKKPVEILIVEQDRDLAEMIEGYLSVAMPARLTSVHSMADALCEELTHRHSALLVSLEQIDGDGLEVVRQLRKSNKCPVILTADAPESEQIIEAMRLGVSDVLIKPFDMREMADRLQKVIHRYRKNRARRRRFNRLRLLTGRIIRERRDLRQRTDLICRDLVQAYRSLAQKVSESGVLAED